MRRYLLSAVIAGAAAAVYSTLEPRMLRLVRRNLGDSGKPPFTVLHISDTHFTRTSKRARDFLAGLSKELGVTPDLIALTGDLIDDDSGIDPIVSALEGLESRYGKFYVLGSHDYYQSDGPSFVKYFDPSKRAVNAKPADSRRLEDGLRATGWRELTNTSVEVETHRGATLIAGVDDPYLHRQRTEHLRRSTRHDVAIGLMHAPEVVSEYALNGFDLALAGHTHAGQVRLPGIGALVTNSSLPAELAGGPHKIGRTWLHVSPGLGTSRFSPVRFGARPEVTLITLS